MDHQRIGRSLRALRQRHGLTQAELAEAAGVSQSLVSLIERGHLDTVALRTIQRVFAVLDTRLDVQVSWRGGGLDRLLDEAHLALVMRRADQLRAGGWAVAVEATYAVFGERGSIDVLGAQAPCAGRGGRGGEDGPDLDGGAGAEDRREGPPRRARLCRDRFRLRAAGGRPTPGASGHRRGAPAGRPARAGARRDVSSTDPRGASVAPTASWGPGWDPVCRD